MRAKLLKLYPSSERSLGSDFGKNILKRFPRGGQPTTNRLLGSSHLSLVPLPLPSVTFQLQKEKRKATHTSRTRGFPIIACSLGRKLTKTIPGTQ